MIRHIVIAIALLIVASFPGFAQTEETILVITNVRADVADGPAFTVSGPQGIYRMTYNVESSASNALPLNDGSTFVLSIWNTKDWLRTDQLTILTTPNYDLALGQLRFLTSTKLAGTYEIKGMVTPSGGDTNAAWVFTWHTLVVTSAPPAASGASVNIVQTNEIAVDVVNNVDNSYSASNIVILTITNVTWITNIVEVGDVQNNITNIIYNSNIVEMVNNIGAVQVFVSNTLSFGFNGGTSTPQFIRFYSGGNLVTGVVDGANLSLFIEGGGGGIATNIIGAYPIIITNDNGNVYVGFASLAGGIVVVPDATNRVILSYLGATNQVYVVPVGVSQLWAYVWGGASGGTAASGAGGYTACMIPVTGSEALTIYIGQGGIRLSGTNAVGVSTSDRAWPDGGRAVVRNNSGFSPSSGAGSSSIWRGTNALVFAGGAGGFVNAASGSGGGLTGGSALVGSAGASGIGGTQTNGGAAGVTTIALWFTNTAGAFFYGGDAGVTTNSVSAGVGGGGGGYFGGSGGLVTTTTAGHNSGGGGSGFVNSALGVIGFTVRGAGALPAGQETDGYQGGWAVPTAVNGGNGGIVLYYVTP
jgi:hypothetical protein